MLWLSLLALFTYLRTISLHARIVATDMVKIFHLK